MRAGLGPLLMHLEAPAKGGLDLFGGVGLQLIQSRRADLLGWTRGGIEADLLHDHVLVVVGTEAGCQPA
ncbi:hypothetical protein D3C86_1896630 [compost metagenome]